MLGKIIRPCHDVRIRVAQRPPLSRGTPYVVGRGKKKILCWLHELSNQSFILTPYPWTTEFFNRDRYLLSSFITADSQNDETETNPKS
jgi:hypothetical protein